VTQGAVGLIVVAAGSARRMGGTDKVWAALGAHPVLWHSVNRFAALVAEIVLVVREDQVSVTSKYFHGIAHLRVTTGGTERNDSVARGLACLNGVDAVAVHDAARPLAPARLLADGAGLLNRFSGAIPVIPVSDTLKEVDQHGRVIATLDRGPLRAAQTPQLFRADVLRHAHEMARRSGASVTDDAQLVEACDGEVVTYPGSPRNIKITTEHDLELARLLLAAG